MQRPATSFGLRILLGGWMLLLPACQRTEDAGESVSGTQSKKTETAGVQNPPRPSTRERETTPVLNTVVEGAHQPHMAIGSDGTVYVTYLRQGNISVSISRDRGKTFSPPVVAIDVQGRARGGAQRGPRIGVGANGSLTVTAPVTFDDAEYKKKYPTADLYLVHSRDRGNTWSKPVRVNAVAKQAPEALHWMTVDATGVAHVAWLDMRARKQPGQNLYYAAVEAGRVGQNVKVAETVCECCAPGIAVDSRGNPILAYREGGDKPSREIFLRRAQSGGGSFAAVQQINREQTLEDG